MPDNIMKELDNFAYAAGALALIIAMVFFDVESAKSLATAVVGAFLMKIKAAND